MAEAGQTPSPGGGAAISRVRRWLPGSAASGQIAWVTVGYVAQQVLRLLTNIVLAALLAPELFGTMMLINTLRMGAEMFTDIGVGQGIVTRSDGDSPRYLGTAWTLQLIRGALLFGLACAFAPSLAAFYGSAELTTLIPVAALIFIFTGLTSPTRHVLAKQLRVRELALFDLAFAVVTSVVSIALAYVIPGIWALMIGYLLSSLLPAVASLFLMDIRLHRLTLDREATRSILSIGKWIFASTLIYFLATNFDRLFLAKEISLALFGVYAIARTYADSATLLFHRLGTSIVFPRIAAHESRGHALRAAISPTRKLALVGIAVTLAGGVALSDTMIELLYDQRYHTAGPMLAILLAGSWFAVLATLADAMILGVGAPSGVALGNAVKLVWIVVTLPLSLHYGGVLMAMVALAASDALRYGALVLGKRRHGLSFVRQDIAFTALFVIAALALRALTGLIGINDGVAGWLEAARTLVG